jgi:hypothetical protein
MSYFWKLVEEEQIDKGTVQSIEYVYDQNTGVRREVNELKNRFDGFKNGGKRLCPSCNSSDLEEINDSNLKDAERCKHCGMKMGY